MNQKLEKEVKVSGKDFESKCKKCQSMLAWNRRIVGKKDDVSVTCAGIYPDCEFLKEKVK